MVLGTHGRSVSTAIFTPFARLLAKLRVTPNMVTLASAVVIAGLSFGVLARGHLAVGGILLGVVLFMDSVDGVLARLTNNSTEYGAFLDSSMDRITDGMVFGSLLWWAIVGLPDSAQRTTAIVAGIVSMVAIGVVPYVRAKAEGFGVVAKMGLAERTDRLIIALVCAGITDWGVPLWSYAIGLIWVAFASTVTVIQRMVYTHQQLGSKALLSNGAQTKSAGA